MGEGEGFETINIMCVQVDDADGMMMMMMM